MMPEIRKRWRDSLITTETWRRADKPAPVGEGGGFFVQSAETGLCAYLKPVKPYLSECPRAAYEKIASDLAFELCLNIPPAVLHVRKNPGDPDDPQAEGEERHVVLSLVPDGRIEELDEKRANDRIKESLANYCGIVAFDAWLGNIDRGFDKNILVNYGDPNNAWFIDYCFTMDYNFRWQGDGYQCFKKLKVPSLMLPGLREGRVKKVIARIQDLDPQVIREICLRLPDAFLTGNRRNDLPGWLIWRKERLLAQIDNWFPDQTSA